ncbi:hypothetical protein BBO99_00009542 [Phytophthora kernoviae]|uniref:BSD domain-containing protein n=2 Tax=Phytophthora kernoviae TaxID=325452 RepID=A0A3R7J1J6_9STRA|nr:hypothetical protein G195_011188 [Phytophthora kernoviae 00238/432]KAG2503041.1 hypothetical protein JM16_009469 [Phytophthora kernoviae]KAG2505236.1 hypothetical protein JM18_009483 [Phytophthora kernoviae]RLN06369.1 hypothetical protein BBI17_009595 [Phytophthora kernoviae]RLN73113.1 hypothetical protein BBO99_00009542 [Phytophthora kernoviae]
MTTLSSDLQDFTSIVQEDVAELSKQVRQNIQERRLSTEKKESEDEAEETEKTKEDQEEKKQDEDQKEKVVQPEEVPTETDDPLTLLKNSLFSFDVSSTLGSLNSVGSTVGNSFNSVSSTVGSKLGSLNVGNSLGSLEAMGSKLLNSADEFLGTLAGDTVYQDDELSEGELNARRFRLLALQEDSETYIEPPLDAETFQKWKATTPAADLAEIQTEVLENYPTVGAKFTELVPSVVEADVFWAHYIYKASLLAAQEQRGADLLEHALNDSEEEIGWDVDSPKAKDDEKEFFPDEESKEEDKVPVSITTSTPTAAAPQTGPSSSDGESWIELDERKDSTSSKDSTSPNASSNLKEPTSTLADLKLDEGDEAAAEQEDSLDWGDDDDLVPETTAASDVKIPESTPVTHEDASKRGEDWGEWD